MGSRSTGSAGCVAGSEPSSSTITCSSVHRPVPEPHVHLSQVADLLAWDSTTGEESLLGLTPALLEVSPDSHGEC